MTGVRLTFNYRQNIQEICTRGLPESLQFVIKISLNIQMKDVRRKILSSVKLLRSSRQANRENMDVNKKEKKRVEDHLTKMNGNLIEKKVK